MTKRYKVSEIMAAIAADPEVAQRDRRGSSWSRTACARVIVRHVLNRPTSIDGLLALWPTYLRGALGLRTGTTLAGRPLVSDAEVCDALVAAARRYGVPMRECEPLMRAT